MRSFLPLSGISPGLCTAFNKDWASAVAMMSFFKKIKCRIGVKSTKLILQRLVREMV